MNKWKELDKNDIPGDFFVNDNYEIEILSNMDDWIIPMETDPLKIVDNMLRNGCQYRYRLKPLPPLEVTRGEYETVSRTINSIERIIKGEHLTDNHRNNDLGANLESLANLLKRMEAR